MSITKIIQQYKKSNQASELINSSFWSIIGSVLSKGLIFVAWILVGRILGSEDYGAFGLIRDTVIMFSAFAGLGLSITASKFVAEYINKDKEKATRILSLTLLFGILAGLFVGITIYFLSPYIADRMIHKPQFATELRIASVMLFFSSLNGAQLGVLQGMQCFKRIAVINLWQAILSFPAFYIGAKYGGIRGAVIAFAFYNIIICILSHIEIHRTLKIHNIRIKFIDSWQEKRILFTYSLPAFISGLMVTPMKWLSDIMLVNTEDGFEKLGIFTAAYTFNSIFLLIVSMLDAPFLVVLSKYKNETINSKLNRVNVILPWCIGTILIIPFIVFPETGRMLFGKTYSAEQFKWAFIFILLFTLIIMYKQGLARILAVHNLQWLGVASNLLWGISLIGSFYYTKEFGAVGLCISYLIGYIASTLVILPVYQRKGLIPQRTVFSWYALIIWAIIIAVSAINIIEFNILYKALVLLVSLLLLIVLFYKYIKD